MKVIDACEEHTHYVTFDMGGYPQTLVRKSNGVWYEEDGSENLIRWNEQEIVEQVWFSWNIQQKNLNDFGEN